MALFKLRKKVDETKAPAVQAESIEAVRRRARHRLIGAVVLVLAGVIGFPLLFDTQPRPVAVDIPIEIPDRDQAAPLPPPSAAPVSVGKVTPSPVVAAPAAPVAQPQPEPAPVQAAETKPAGEDKVVKAEPAAEKKPEPKAESRPEPKDSAAEAAKAQALLEGKSVDTAGARYVVQVGAFAEKDKARQAQQKLERAGLKNYTHVAETSKGPRIRVRAGPFGSRAEADRAAQKIKGLDLPAAILTL